MVGSKEEILSPEISPCKAGGSTPRIGVGTVVSKFTLAAAYCVFLEGSVFGDYLEAP
jgi:hypothetical protein